MVGHFPTIQCNVHFRKNRNVLNKSCSTLKPTDFPSEPTGRPHLWCGFQLKSSHWASLPFLSILRTSWIFGLVESAHQLRPKCRKGITGSQSRRMFLVLDPLRWILNSGSAYNSWRVFVIFLMIHSLLQVQAEEMDEFIAISINRRGWSGWSGNSSRLYIILIQDLENKKLFFIHFPLFTSSKQVIKCCWQCSMTSFLCFPSFLSARIGIVGTACHN